MPYYLKYRYKSHMKKQWDHANATSDIFPPELINKWANRSGLTQYILDFYTEITCEELQTLREEESKLIHWHNENW